MDNADTYIHADISTYWLYSMCSSYLLSRNSL